MMQLTVVLNGSFKTIVSDRIVVMAFKLGRIAAVKMYFRSVVFKPMQILLTELILVVSLSLLSHCCTLGFSAL